MRIIICTICLSMAPPNVQSLFLEQVKKRLATNISLADEIAEILNISRDSAYRRIRGETVLSIDEAKILCDRFGVSLDILFGTPAGIVPFRHLAVNHAPHAFEKWLRTMLESLETLTAYNGEKEIVFTAKDIPVFHYFHYPDLCAFKMFFWMKSVLDYPEFQGKKFERSLISGEYFTLGRKIWQTYNKIPTVELWVDETINVTLKQLEFYHDAGFFKTKEDIAVIFEQYSQLLRDICQQATDGYTFEKAPYSLYKNEILIADNTAMFTMGNKKSVYISHNITEVLSTANEDFCQQTEAFIQNLQKRSIHISTTGEKERNRFFNSMAEKVEVVRKKILS